MLTIVEGPRAGTVVSCQANVPRAAAVQAAFAAVFAEHGQPAVLQTDRGPCFVGTEGGASKAVPGRFTLWLWGLDIDHQLTPPGKPQRNGAAERFNGAIEQSWADEPGGLDALCAVWNVGKTSRADEWTPYRGRTGFDLAAVWQRLAAVRITRQVDRQGKLSLWDRPVRVGKRYAGQAVQVTFDASTRQIVLYDERGFRLQEMALPWLTEAWLWADVPLAAQASDPLGDSTLG